MAAVMRDMPAILRDFSASAVDQYTPASPAFPDLFELPFADSFAPGCGRWNGYRWKFRLYIIVFFV